MRGLTSIGLLALAACGAPSLEDRIAAVESGLVLDLSDPPWRTMRLADRMAEHRVPGLSYAVIDDFGIAWTRSHGVVEAGTARRVTPATLFQTASIGKPVIAATALGCMREAKLGLDDDVAPLLTGWRLPPNEFTARSPVTLRRLLSHSAGVTVRGFAGYPRGAALPTLRQILDGAPPANSAPIRVDALPGARYRYSGGGYLIVQQLLQERMRRSLDQLVTERVFRPLGMQHSRFAPLPEVHWPQAAVGHRADGRVLDGKWRVYPEWGAGPFWSTASDMALFGIGFMDAHQGRSERMLATALAQQMLTAQPGGAGLGFGLGDDGGDRRHAVHLGGNEGYRSTLVLYPERGQGVVIMTNGEGGEALAAELVRSLSREFGWVPGLVLRTWMVVVAGAVLVVCVLLFAWRVRRRRARARLQT